MAALQLRGFCPVAYSTSYACSELPWTSIIHCLLGRPTNLVRGDVRFVVEYDRRYFAMADAESMAAFMRTPWKFHSLPTPQGEPAPQPASLTKCV